ncbi:hypothetical protein [Dokdonella sp.]|uniref:hypothetical protein n=1 Tax=Dokdonella sp. TaxID=2291710 RepID=UPI003782F961
MNSFLKVLACAGIGLLLCRSIALADEDKGESKSEMAAKNRHATPTTAQIDEHATLAALLDKSSVDAWSSEKAARLEGVLVQVENEEDGDTHIVLAPMGEEKNTARWVIAEVTRASRAHHKDLGLAKLKGLRGKKVAVTGWLYYEPDTDSEDPRGTRWEIHPVTSITAL